MGIKKLNTCTPCVQSRNVDDCLGIICGLYILQGLRIILCSRITVDGCLNVHFKTFHSIMFPISATRVSTFKSHLALAHGHGHGHCHGHARACARARARAHAHANAHAQSLNVLVKFSTHLEFVFQLAQMVSQEYHHFVSFE